MRILFIRSRVLSRTPASARSTRYAGIAFEISVANATPATLGKYWTQQGHTGGSPFTTVQWDVAPFGASYLQRSFAKAMEAFRGVRQRFEVMSSPGAPVAIVNDFAHNPEKLSAVISAARERYGSPLAMVWQPHGFKALGDQREALQEALEKVLRPDDLFLMLPVYYAGGTTSGKPTSAEVCGQYAAAGLPVEFVATRQEVEARFRSSAAAKTWLGLGARDASLRTWTKQLADAR